MAKVTHLAISFPHQTPKSGIERWAVQQTCDILHLRLELAYVIVTTDNPLGTAAFLRLRKKVLVLCNNRCLCTLSFQRLNFLNLFFVSLSWSNRKSSIEHSTSEIFCIRSAIAASIHAGV